MSKQPNKAANDWIRNVGNRRTLTDAPTNDTGEPTPTPTPTVTPGHAGAGTAAPPAVKLTMNELIRRLTGRNW